MAKKIPLGLRPGDERDIMVAKFEIENEQTFQFKQLYKIMYEWLLEEGWDDQYLPGNENFEHLYLEKTLPDGAQEHLIWWRCQFVPYNNRYYRYVMHIDFQTVHMAKAQVMHKGHKFKTYEGDLILRVESHLQLDYRDEWQKHWLLNQFDRPFRTRIYKKNIDSYKKDLYNTTYRFQNMIKTFLQLKTSFEGAEPFHPRLGI